jgi:hypothetical protein
MRRLAIFSLILTILVGADGIYMLATHYQPSDVNHFNLSDGGTVVVLAIVLLIVSIIAFMKDSQLSKKQGSSKNA